MFTAATIVLNACPWNKFEKPTAEPALLPKIELTAPRLRELAQLHDAGFRAFFQGSPIKRTGRDRFIRNVAIAIGNSADTSLLDVLDTLRTGRCRGLCAMPPIGRGTSSPNLTNSDEALTFSHGRVAKNASSFETAPYGPPQDEARISHTSS